MSTSRRRAVIQIDSPAIQAMNRDNTIGGEAEPPVAQSERCSSPPPSAGPSPLGNTHQSQRANNESRGRTTATSNETAPTAAPAIFRKKTVSFRTGLTSRAVIGRATAIAASHHGDPDLVLRRFVRDALGALHARIAAGEFDDFVPVSVRPQSLLALDTSTRITSDDLERLAARIDPMGVFRPSAAIGFAVDQILTERLGS